MTLLFNTGFDWVDTASSATIKAQLAYDKWVLTDTNNTTTMGGGTGLYGGKYISYPAAGANGNLSRAISGSPQTIICGFLFRTVTLPTAGPHDIAWFLDSTTIQTSLRLNNNGSLGIYRGSTLLGASAAGVINLNTWYFIEWKLKVDPSTGTAEVRIDGSGSPVINLTGANTRNASNSYVTGFALGRGSSNNGDSTWGPVNFDDVYICNTSGSLNNDFIGACRSEAQTPTSDVLTGMTPSTGANHYAVVDEVPLSATADYLSASAAAEDRFGVSALGSTPASIKGVSVVSFALKTDAGTCTARNRITSGGSTGDGTTVAAPTSIGSIRDVFETDPSTGVAFTPAAMSSVQIGVERVS